jgi:predicted NBD/HSP70 family sugar kinase
MRFYNHQYRHYCGIDLHVKTMYVCILDAAGQVLVHRNVPSTPEAFLEIDQYDALVIDLELTIVREAKRTTPTRFTGSARCRASGRCSR